MEKFFLKNMGCKANQLEGAIIMEKMINAGYLLTEKEKDAAACTGGSIFLSLPHDMPLPAI